MKRIFLVATLTAATVVSACGDQAQSVTRTQTVPLNFSDFGADLGGATSTRSSIDLLSLS
ncbi:MAG: hypothetical protein ABJR46_05560 [Tateyamaria sp.]|uniref:hypothetical protein n=1 Tax=Tateyamaria sp. TaxID=1929288 RepID=UPI00326C52BC